MTDSPDQPPKPHPERTAQLAALVEDVPEDESGDVGEDEAPGDDQDAPEGEEADFASSATDVPIVSRPPPLLPKEKSQVRKRAFLIGGVVFVVCVALAIGVVVVIGHAPATPRPPVAARPVAPPPPPVAVAPSHPHTHITLDEIVFTSDGGAHP